MCAPILRVLIVTLYTFDLLFPNYQASFLGHLFITKTSLPFVSCFLGITPRLYVSYFLIFTLHPYVFSDHHAIHTHSTIIS